VFICYLVVNEDEYIKRHVMNPHFQAVHYCYRFQREKNTGFRLHLIMHRTIGLSGSIRPLTLTLSLTLETTNKIVFSLRKLFTWYIEVEY